MHEFIEEGMRSDISYVAKTYSKGNNKHIESYDYNDTKPSKYVTYWDANNLYPWAMSQYLPYDGFIWLRIDEINKFDLNWYTSELDLKYRNELHELDNDCPLALERLEIVRNILSNYCNDIAKEDGIKVGGAIKLVPRLSNINIYSSLWKFAIIFIVRDEVGLDLLSFGV